MGTRGSPESVNFKRNLQKQKRLTSFQGQSLWKHKVGAWRRMSESARQSCSGKQLRSRGKLLVLEHLPRGLAIQQKRGGQRAPTQWLQPRQSIGSYTRQHCR